MDKNFYIVLDLDHCVNDLEIIQKSIETKKKEWRRDIIQGYPQKQREAKNYLGLLQKIENELNNSGSRESIRHEAALIRLKKQIEEKIKIFGKVFPKTISNEFYTIFGCILDKDEICKKCKELGVTEENSENSFSNSEPCPRIDPIIAKSIRELLQLVKVDDLYEFLGCNYNDSTN